MNHRTSFQLTIFLSCCVLIACGSDRRTGLPIDDGAITGDAGSDSSEPLPTGLSILGGGEHLSTAVEVTTIATDVDGLNVPRDLDFHPTRSDELWVINLADSSTVIISGAGSPSQNAGRRAGPGNTHFMARPAALAFGANGNFATAQEEDSVTQDSTPEDFMGPSLWTSDLAIYDGGHAGHLDMLHNSPNSVGIAWERDNVYWVVDGMHRSITRYDFQADHGPGGSDHSDGIVARYVEGQIGYVAGVPSHAEIDQTTGLLYVADTGNNRIAILDTAIGSRGAPIGPNYDGVDQYEMDGAMLTTFVDGSAAGLVAPSGLLLHEGHVFVTDNETSRIVAFNLEGGEVDYLDLSDVVSTGALMGIAAGSDGALYLVDATSNRLLRVAALAAE